MTARGVLFEGGARVVDRQLADLLAGSLQCQNERIVWCLLDWPDIEVGAPASRRSHLDVTSCGWLPATPNLLAARL